MLVDEPGVMRDSYDPIMLMVAAVNDRSGLVKHLQPGVYQIGHFGSSAFLSATHEAYPELEGPTPADYVGCYGVCDDITNLMAKCPMLAAHPTRQFTVVLTPVQRDPSNKGKGGGWRWHKWGEYIGSQEPTMEYIDDEPVVNLVYCYHVYEKL